jgi:Tol biopolymer transport system component
MILERMLWITLLLLFAFLAAACSAPPQPTAIPTTGEVQVTPAQPTRSPDSTSPPLDTLPGYLDLSGHSFSGRLLVNRYLREGNELGLVDLSSGDFTPIFRAPENSYLSWTAASPDGKQAVLAYAAPPEDGAPQYGFTDLYLISLEGPARPEPFLLKQSEEEIYFNPSWAPDGQAVYYSYFYNADPGKVPPDYRYAVARTSLDGQTELLLEDAVWPVVSPDGDKLAYLSFDMDTFNNELYLADVDGSGSTPVSLPGIQPTVDAHLFTADSQALIFSMVNNDPGPGSSWLEKWLGVSIAYAHNVPSDWYQVPLEGGSPRRLTRLGGTGLSGDLSPDGTQMAFIAGTGLYILNLEDGELVHLSEEILVGTVDWIP